MSTSTWAAHLTALREQTGLTKEALAGAVGVTEAEIAAWEDGSAVPGANRVTRLAAALGVSVEELLAEPAEDATEDAAENTVEEDADRVVIRHGRIYVKDGHKQVIVEPGHIEVHGDGDHDVNIGGGHVVVDGEEKHPGHLAALEFPLCSLLVLVYLFLGFMWDAWHPGWLIFFLHPLIHGVASMIRHRHGGIRSVLNHFPYPVLAAGVYLLLGCVYGVWHPTWLVFLTIPLYYGFANLFPARAVFEDAEPVHGDDADNVE